MIPGFFDYAKTINFLILSEKRTQALNAPKLQISSADMRK
jgi:hypothetical protein